METIKQPSVFQFSCDLCGYSSKSQKGINIHKGSQHKNRAIYTIEPLTYTDPL